MGVHVYNTAKFATHSMFGTLHGQISLVGEAHHATSGKLPSGDGSSLGLDALKRKWMTWAGHPEVLRCDRGLRNRGVLAQWMSSHGVQVHHAPLETPEAIGRVERHGGVIKGMARKVVSQTQAVGRSSVQSVLDECCTTKNSLLRHGGYSPYQWVLGKAPRGVPSLMDEEGHADLGAIQDTIDPESRFALQHQARAEAKKACVHMDTSKRVQRALKRELRPRKHLCIWTLPKESSEHYLGMLSLYPMSTP